MRKETFFPKLNSDNTISSDSDQGAKRRPRASTGNPLALSGFQRDFTNWDLGAQNQRRKAKNITGLQSQCQQDQG